MQENLAAVYDSSSKIYQSKFSEELLQKLSEPLQRGWKVLDIGCGTGTNTETIARQVGETGLVVAVDPNGDRIDLFKKRAEDQRLTQLIIVNTGAEKLDYDTYAPLDLVHSNAVLHWIEDKSLRQIVHKVYQSLRSGGYFAATISEVKPANEGDILDIFYQLFPEDARQQFFSFVHSRDLSWYTELLQEFGFEIVDQGSVLANVEFKDLEDMAAKMTASADRRVDFEKYISVEKLQQLGIDFKKDGSFSIRSKSCYFIARKP